jgi:hypothetical protein
LFDAEETRALDQDKAEAKRRELAASLRKAKPAKAKARPEQIDPERLSKAIRYLKDHPKQ